MITPEGKEVDYSYDQTNRLARIDSWAGSFTFGYDLLGRRTKLTYPNGVATNYSFDPLGNLIEILTSSSRGKKKELVSAFTYTHDQTGNRITKTVLNKNELGTRYNYDYDPAYRLLQSLPVKLEGKDKSQPQKAGTFAYDPVGNRVVGPKTTDTYVQNQGNQLLEGPKYRFQYDKYGNLVGKTGVDEEGKSASWSYGYDADNQLVRVAKMDREGTKVTTFKYDPFGRRIEKRDEELGEEEGLVYAYVYDNEDIILELLSKTEGHREQTESSHHSTNKSCQSIKTGGHQEQIEITRYLHGQGIDEPLAVEQKGDISFYHADGLGSITSLTDATGRVVQSYEYSSYGIPKQHGNHVKQPYTYTGREWDEETGLYFYRARYYDPAVGRFISKDPIGFAGGVNFYAYVQNNPVNRVDPSGMQPPPIVPPGVNISANTIKSPGLSSSEFIEAVRSGGEWDFKKNGNRQYENFGNYHFGVVAAARGLSESDAQMGAGVYQAYSDLSRGGLGNVQWQNAKYYYDNPNDQYWISEGVKDYLQGMYNAKSSCNR